MTKSAPSEPEMWAVIAKEDEVLLPTIDRNKYMAELEKERHETLWPDSGPYTVKRVRIEVIEP